MLIQENIIELDGVKYHLLSNIRKCMSIICNDWYNQMQMKEHCEEEFTIDIEEYINSDFLYVILLNQNTGLVDVYCRETTLHYNAEYYYEKFSKCATKKEKIELIENDKEIQSLYGSYHYTRDGLVLQFNYNSHYCKESSELINVFCEEFNKKSLLDAVEILHCQDDNNNLSNVDKHNLDWEFKKLLIKIINAKNNFLAYQECAESDYILAYSHNLFGLSSKTVRINSHISIDIIAKFGYGIVNSFLDIILNYKGFNVITNIRRRGYNFKISGNEFHKKFISTSCRNGSTLIYKSWEDIFSFIATAYNLSIISEFYFEEIFILKRFEILSNKVITLSNKNTENIKNEQKITFIDQNRNVILDFYSEYINAWIEYNNEIKFGYNRLERDAICFERICNCGLRMKPIIEEHIERITSNLLEFRKITNENNAENSIAFIEKIKLYSVFLKKMKNVY